MIYSMSKQEVSNDLYHHWLKGPFVDLPQVATYLYGHRSRLHTQRLKAKISGSRSFQDWEIERLEALRKALLEAMDKVA